MIVPLVIECQQALGHRVPRRREPVRLGVPFPEGACTASDWHLQDDNGLSFPVQAKVIDRWSDGSVRWLLVDSQIDLSETSTLSLRLISAPTPSKIPSGSGVAIKETQDGVVVDTGAAQFRLRRNGRFPFDDVLISGESMLDPSSSGFDVADANGRTSTVVTRQLAVVDRGPLRVTVVIHGSIPDGKLKVLNVLGRVDFYAGSPTVRLSIRLRNPQRARHRGGFWDLGDRGSVYIEDAGLTLSMPVGLGTSTIRCSPEVDAAWQPVGTPFELYQDSSGGENWRSRVHINRERRIPTSFRGYRARSGSVTTHGNRAAPILSVAHASRQVSIAVPYFWQNFPKALEASATALTLRILPHQYNDLYELQGGEQKTHVCFLAFAADLVTEEPLEWCRSPLHVRAEPSWYVSTDAVPWLGEDDPDRHSLVCAAVEGPDTFVQKRETVDEYGWRNFGDVYGDHEAVRHAGQMPLVSHYNNQYDPIAGFISEYLRSGDSRWWSMAVELAAHVIDIDVYHTARDKWSYNNGLFWHTYHYGDADTSSHRTYPRAARRVIHGGGPSPDHNYTTGLMLHYFLTGDDASRETVIDLAQFVIDADDGRKTVLRLLSGADTGYATASGSYSYHGPGRGPANSLNALVDGHRLTGNQRFLTKAEQIIRRVVHPSEDIARLQLDDPENRWFYLMFLQSLGKYLRVKADVGALDDMYCYGRATLLHYARWMRDHEYPYLSRPEKLTFPTETWAAHEIRKSDVFCHAALHANEAEREQFLERGRFFFREAVTTLQRMHTRTLARPVVVLLSSGLLQPWLERHPTATARQPAGPEPAYGSPATFVPQKQQALRRMKMLILLLGVAITSSLLLRGLHWLHSN